MMRLFSRMAAMTIVLWPMQAIAGTLSLRLTDSAGRPIEDAVVTVVPATKPSRPLTFPWPSEMVQKNIAFIPHVLIVPVGATVRFPNRDAVRHHIYSFSKPARFEMKLYGREETRSYTFASPGTVALGCNIHDRMTGFIRVVDTPFAAKSDRSGALSIDGLSAGVARVTIWHPRLKTRDNELMLTLPVPARGSLDKIVQLDLRP